MRRLELSLLISGVLAFSACSSSTSNPTTGKGGADGGAGHGGSGGGSAGATAGTDGGVAGSSAGAGGGDAATDMVTPDADAGDAIDAAQTPEQARGQYLVNSVLGCGGCHTPKAVDGGTPVQFSGIDCFVNTTSEAGTNCLSSANLTNDPAGIKNLTDLQVINAFTKGVFPAAADAGTQYLFANMPYYQFSNLTMSDATAIVAYLRSVPTSSHAPATDTGTFATRPTAAQWTPVAIADPPNPAAADGGTDAGSDAGADAGTVDAGATGNATNGKYLATLACSVCHTVNTSATSPLMLDATKAFQGGKEFTTTVTVPVDAGSDAGADGGTDAAATTMVMKKIQSANLTPDTTGLQAWTPAQIVTAIKNGKDEAGRSICSPMRPFPTMTDQDALDIATYLKAIPAATNAITETCE